MLIGDLRQNYLVFCLNIRIVNITIRMEFGESLQTIFQPIMIY